VINLIPSRLQGTAVRCAVNNGCNQLLPSFRRKKAQTLVNKEFMLEGLLEISDIRKVGGDKYEISSTFVGREPTLNPSKLSGSIRSEGVFSPSAYPHLDTVDSFGSLEELLDIKLCLLDRNPFGITFDFSRFGEKHNAFVGYFTSRCTF
jgi:hypothetical protein